MTGTTWLKQCWSIDEKNFTWFYSAFFIIIMGFPGGSYGKESICNAGDLGSICGLGRSLGGEHGNPLQYSGLENSKDCIVHGVANSQTWLSNFHFHFSLSCIGEGNGNSLHCSCLENPMDRGAWQATVCGVTELDTTEQLSLSLFTFMHWKRKWQPTPVFLPGESQGWGSIVGCQLWGRTELDTTEAT